MQEPIFHPSQSKLLKTGWIEIYPVYQVTSSRFPHADDTQIVYHSQHTLGDAGAVSQEKKRDESFQSFQACKEGLFRPCLKTFVAPFLPARLSLRGWTRRGLKNVCVGSFEVTDRKWDLKVELTLLTSVRSTGKNNGFPFLDILGYVKNTHKNPKFGRVRLVPITELGWEFPGWDLSHFAKFGIFMGIL